MNREIATKYLIDLDELNLMLAVEYSEPSANNIRKMESFFETLLIHGYKRGRKDCEDMLDYVLDTEIDLELLDQALGKKYEGKTYKDRVSEYVAENNYEALLRVAETEFHRMYGQGSLDAAKAYTKETGKKLIKTWVTMQDDRVRDTHVYLDGMTVNVDEKFVTYDGDSAMFPGGFEMAFNNVNCRCILDYSIQI